ncbi:MAG TPA: OFA family MFS transporter [Gemmatimonadales bacterium]|nr:OFA family MFS transporter [Gemmatimonadales bacterium]
MSSGLLSKERIIAGPGFNRWLVPPAALAIHLSIGMAYGLSVFWLPLSHAIGMTAPAPGDWKVSTLGWTFSLGIVFLGLSAAVFGRWLERTGPRKAGVVAAFCWGGGFLVGALGVHLHSIWLLYFGIGIIGGCGLGLGYISPVSTLIRWFPDRRGMATGMAIMGFGGGAMIGSPLANLLMNHYKTATSVGVQETFVTLGAIYFVAMLAGAFGYRLPSPGWQPVGWTPPPAVASGMITARQVHVDQAWRTPQFWLLWTVLCMNVSAGIGVINMASPMLQEVFGGKLIGGVGALRDLADSDKVQVATIGAGFAALLSLFNIAGRIFWASLSDLLGRKRTYFIFFALGTVLYAAAPSAGRAGTIPLFVAIFCVILTMYGGGFATIPAYLADLFGTQHVGAIHGRLLTAWSVAGVLGPVVVNYLRDYQLGRGVPAADAYSTTMYILAALLVVGFWANLMVRPVADRHFMTEAQLAYEQRQAHEAGAAK